MITEQIQWLDVVDIFIVFKVILSVSSSLSSINNHIEFYTHLLTET